MRVEASYRLGSNVATSASGSAISPSADHETPSLGQFGNNDEVVMQAMISTLIVNGTRSVAPLVRAAAVVLTARVDEPRVPLHAIVDEVLRYLYVVSLAPRGAVLILSGVFVVFAVIVALEFSDRAGGSAPGLRPPAAPEADRKAA